MHDMLGHNLSNAWVDMMPTTPVADPYPIWLIYGIDPSPFQKNDFRKEGEGGGGGK